jgi:uncharacterized protein (DUF2461 family)
MSGAHFTPKLFAFPRDLAKNNDRDWFKANQERFERDVREPLLRFITDSGPGFAKISEQIVVDARKAGESGFLSTFIKDCRGASPLMAFLADAVDIPW